MCKCLSAELKARQNKNKPNIATKVSVPKVKLMRLSELKRVG